MFKKAKRSVKEVPPVVPPKILVQRVHVDAVLPQYMTEGAACMDLTIPQDVHLSTLETQMVDLGYRIQIPDGYMGMVVSRSGWTMRGVTVANAPGIIDSDYRGVMKLLLHAKRKTLLEAGTRIAQLMLVPVVETSVEEGTIPLMDTARGPNGFGSTGD